MSNKAQYILYSILDFGLTFGGTAGVIVYNYITPTNSLGFKLSMTGVLLLVALVFTAKAIFEKSYREKHDTLLQQLAEATDMEIKAEISKKIEAHKLKNNIYQRLMVLLPFALLFAVTFIADASLQDLQGTLALILASMGAGSVFNVIKKPIRDKISVDKVHKKIEKRKSHK